MSDVTPPASSPSSPSATFLLNVTVGVAAGLVALIVLILAGRPTSDGEAFLLLSARWPVAAICGFLACCLMAYRQSRLGGVEPKIAAAGPIAFGVPSLIAILFTAGFSRLEPGMSHDYELSFGTLLVVLLGVGLFMAFILRKRDLADPFSGFLATPLIGLFLVAGWFGYTMVTSNDFVYRDAFAIQEVQMQRLPDGVVVTAVLELKKGGEFTYEARSFWLPMDEGEGHSDGKITWEGGVAPVEEGVYPFEVAWTDLPAEVANTIGNEAIVDSSLGLTVRKAKGDKVETIRYLTISQTP